MNASCNSLRPQPLLGNSTSRCPHLSTTNDPSGYAIPQNHRSAGNLKL